MAEKMGITEIGVVRLLRYGYGGVLLFFLLALINHAKAKEVIEALGPVMAPLVALALGAAIYVLHRHVVGELFLYRLFHCLHSNVWDRWYGRTGVNATDSVAYLRAIGAARGEGRAAYNMFRRRYFAEHEMKDTAEGLDLAHTELHMLWLTFDEVLLAGIYVLLTGGWKVSAPFLIVAALVACGGICAELVQMQIETGLLKAAQEKKELQPFLEKYGIHLTPTANTSEVQPVR